MKRQQQGFTLIELVIVIVILGILSAFALPRFADLSGDARSSSIEGLAGSMKSATGVVRSACLASSECDQSSADDSVDLSGETINVVYGYPSAEENGIGFAAQVSSSDYVPNGGSWGTDGVDQSVVLTVPGDSGGTGCAATYSAPAASGGSLSSPASVSTNVDDC
ncbi:type II secretion system protein [Salicola sp. Rm-C-2C1-2]|uniref:type II secretion system protein n=1 Tax=Salicola sp. Rm-C-2C1-2 TaxID=3141321 RepID=UPI0032E4D960